MGLSIQLTCSDEISIPVTIEEPTPLGFQGIIAHSDIDYLRDESGRYRMFDMVVNTSSNKNCDKGYEILGQCLVHSVRRISAQQSVICVRYENQSMSAYNKMVMSNGAVNNISPVLLRQA